MPFLAVPRKHLSFLFFDFFCPIWEVTTRNPFITTCIGLLRVPHSSALSLSWGQSFLFSDCTFLLLHYPGVSTYIWCGNFVMLENLESVRIADLSAIYLHRNGFGLGIRFSHRHDLSLGRDDRSWSRIRLFCLSHYFKYWRFHLSFRMFKTADAIFSCFAC